MHRVEGRERTTTRQAHPVQESTVEPRQYDPRRSARDEGGNKRRVLFLRRHLTVAAKEAGRHREAASFVGGQGTRQQSGKRQAQEPRTWLRPTTVREHG